MKTLKFNIFYKIGIAIVAAMLFKLLFFRLSDFWDIDLFIIPFIVLILWEGNIYIDRFLENKIGWLAQAQKRILLQVILSLAFSAITLYVMMNFMHFMRFGEIRLFNRSIQHMFIPAIIITFLVLALHISKLFFKAWKQSLLDVEKYKTESANAQLQNLKNQLNPHFLFNNLSVLSSLVYQNQDKAVDFINELSKVYRYLLDNKNTELASLQEELDFLEHYIYLLKIRFGNNISFDISIFEADKQKYLPPMCLQTLVENTIQHNEASLAKPLNIKIFSENNNLVIQNPIQHRSDKVESSETGLKNMEIRYQFFTDEKISIIQNKKIFKVILPLILRQ